MLGRKKVDAEPPVSEDPTAWLIDSGLAEFLLLYTAEMRYMAMLCYTFLHGKFGYLPVRLLIGSSGSLSDDKGPEKRRAERIICLFPS